VERLELIEQALRPGWRDGLRETRQGLARRVASLHAKLERNFLTVTALAVCAVTQLLLFRRSVSIDAWYALLGGRTIALHGLPHRDTWTVLTLGHRWVDEEWLSQLFFYGAWHFGGWALALLVVFGLYLGSFLVVASLARGLGASDRAVAFVVAGGFLVGLGNSVLRAQIPAYLLFAVVLSLLIRDARRPSRRVFLVFPILILWTNVHGSVALGAGLVALRGALALQESLGRRRPQALPRAIALVGLPWLCVLASPYGLGEIHYFRITLDNSSLTHVVTEWAPATIRSEPLFFALLAASIWLVSRARGATTFLERLTLAATGLAGLYAVRYEIWFGLTAGAVVPLALQSVWGDSIATRRTRLNQLLAGGALAAVAAVVLVQTLHGNGWFARSYPAEAAAVVAREVRAEPSARVFADEQYADWLLFEQPGLEGRVAYDARFELLSRSQLMSIADFRTESGIGWTQAASGYSLLVLGRSSDRGAIAHFLAQPGAKVLYRSGSVVVLSRA
jgi:hypothetical protein